MVLPLTPNRDRVTVVRSHRYDTTAYLLARQPNCLRIAKVESDKLTGRRVRLLTPESLARLTPSPSWCMAIILCPGDELDPVVKWAVRLPRQELNRVWFYLAQGLDAAATLQPWNAAGLGDPLWTDFKDFVDFNRIFANDLTEQIYQDHRTGV